MSASQGGVQWVGVISSHRFASAIRTTATATCRDCPKHLTCAFALSADHCETGGLDWPCHRDNLRLYSRVIIIIVPLRDHNSTWTRP